MFNLGRTTLFSRALFATACSIGIGMMSCRQTTQLQHLALTCAPTPAAHSSSLANRSEASLLTAAVNGPFTDKILLNFRAASSSEIDLTWSIAVGLTSSHWLVQRISGDQAYSTVVSVDNSTHSFSDLNLLSDTRYFYRVCTQDQSACSYSGQISTLAAFVVDPTHSAPTRTGGYQSARPSKRSEPQFNRRNNIFFVGEPVTVQLGGAASSYEVRNYYGDLVATGLTAPTLNLPVSEPGWYKLYVYAKHSDPTFGDAIGGAPFVIFRKDANFPARPPGNDSNGGMDETLRGIIGLGPERMWNPYAPWPEGMINSFIPEVEKSRSYYLGRDPVRPRSLLMSFNDQNRAQDLSGVQRFVTQFHDDFKYWSGQNEPDNGGPSPEQLAQSYVQLSRSIKAVDSTAKVIGPNTVDIKTGFGGSGSQYIDRFLSALQTVGGSLPIDGVSFHAYNILNGDLWMGRQHLNAFQAMLAKHGLGKIELWQTEQGYYASMYGAYLPRHQGRWTMDQMLLFERYGLPKEHNVYWQMVSGFWEQPNWVVRGEDRAMEPVGALMRVYSEEVFGTTFANEFDLGPTGNKLYLGNLYKGPKKMVASFISLGSTDGQVELAVKGGTAVHLVSALGTQTDLPIVNGRVTIPVPELPVYVEFAPDQSVTAIPQDWGSNFALAGAKAETTGNNSDAGKLIDGKLQNWYFDGETEWSDNVTLDGGATSTVELQCDTPKTIGRMLVYANSPWQVHGSLLDYELQFLSSGGQWITAERIQESPKTLGVFTPLEYSTVDSFYSDRWVFQHNFPAVTTSRLRLVIHDATYGGGATRIVAEAGGQTGPHIAGLREIEVYGPGTSPGPAPSVMPSTNPSPSPAPKPSPVPSIVPSSTPSTAPAQEIPSAGSQGTRCL